MTHSLARSGDERKDAEPQITIRDSRSLRYGVVLIIGWIRLTISPALALVACGALLAQSGTRINHSAAPPWDAENAQPRSIWDFQTQALDSSAPRSFMPRRTTAAGTVTLHQLTHKIPKKAVRQYEDALKAQSHGDRDTAIEHLSKAVAIDPQFWEALNNLGVNLFLTNRIDFGIEQLRKAIAVDPHAPVAYANLSMAFFKEHKFADAEQAARQDAAMDPLAKTGPLILGTSLILQHKFTLEAEGSLKNAAKWFPQARIPLAVVLAHRGQVDSARQELRLYFASGDVSQTGLANRVAQELDSFNLRAGTTSHK
jgi:tetratricopeptide (TPR) repeat protein